MLGKPDVFESSVKIRGQHLIYGKVMKRVTHSLLVWSRRSAANHGAGYCMNVSMLLISRGPSLKQALMKGCMCAPRNKPIKSCSLQENKNKI